jgi:hypothetical protein
MRAALLILPLLFLGCTKEITPQAKDTRVSYQSLGDILQGDYHCYRAEYPDGTNTYHFNASVMLELLGDWQTNPSAFDLNDDQIVDTPDLLAGVGGYGSPQPDHPPLTDFTPFDDFGEGNTWLTYTGSDPDIVFGWMHRTPYDETNDANYVGYEGIYTWTLDVVRSSGTVYYYFVKV